MHGCRSKKPANQSLRFGLIVATIFAALTCGLVASADSMDDGTRILSFDGGSVAFPSTWKEIKGDDPGRFVLRSPDNLIQATVSILRFSPIDTEQNKARFNQMVELRLEAERVQVPAPAEVIISEPNFAQLPDGTMIATYEGSEASSRRFMLKMVMREGMLVFVYTEALGESQAKLRSISNNIFESISVHQR